MESLNNLKFDKNGLVPVIAQEANSGRVLMQAYANLDAIKLTLEQGFAYYYSRSRQQLWKKGETSGSLQKIIRVSYDCDGDCVLYVVEQTGNACHTGEHTCFYRDLLVTENEAPFDMMPTLYKLIEERKNKPIEGSYTNYLLNKGVEKICKKIGEEATETVIAAVKDCREEIIYEASDLIYHLFVLLKSKDISLDDVNLELKKRHLNPPKEKK